MKTIKLSTYLLYFLLSGTSTAFAQSTEKTTVWKGFEKVEFAFENTTAWYIKPAQALPGNPWVWRAHFPTWHTEMDSILLSRGFHIAYVNTNDWFGHPKAMRVWDAFYSYLTGSKNFAPKVALEGVSRGGLYVYGWAKRNPEKVICIYAEAPVCDPKSWPGGQGKGTGSPKDWERWLELYGLTDQTAKDFKDIPLHNLEGMAAFKIPILHVISLKDKIVPPEENTFPLVEAYTRLGGPATIYSMSRGEQTLEGHHFPIEHPERWADFIQQHSVPVQQLLPHEPYLEPNRGVGNALSVFERKKAGTVAFLGGSITHNPGWRNKVAQYLQERFSDTQFTFITAGIPSLGSTPHAFRFGKDVLEKGTPDLLFVESAVNDRTNGFSKEAQIRALEGILQQAYEANPAMSVVLMPFADPDKFGDYNAGREPVEVAVHRQVAAHYGASFINLSQEIYDRVQAREFSWTYDFKDLHPSPYGQELYFQSIKTLLQNADLNSQTESIQLPAPLDKFSYSKAHYVALEEAEPTKGFKIDPQWKPYPPLATRPGFVDVPMLIGEVIGDSFKLNFTGRAIGIAVVSGPDAGILSYRIDGKKAQTIDLFTQWSQQLHLPWYLLLADTLKPGNHTVDVTISDKTNPASSGNACRIVYFLVND
ncbi:SGNH/GDSL hydrolase family protein [Arundinibacter roseus]|uniref:SGNH/GDSL hydrolase family protein n=1 Tax=Arundinibacter roseus TaxID=2070510 RepID=A0A4R4KAJ9_9BACT|nr:SGNH/GDSL hydrolase family protein [Arundinibacter roseus]TDB63606.1 SGNH/GDSL hydrolase family protein [Arundinibacter roseus]